ncbi:MAG: hypothetical protein K5750_05680 [Eubacterium sp.]|nr:hypothetical protein [Eubacterium sp.]
MFAANIRKKNQNRGSLAFEAAISLPIFMFCMYCFLIFCRIIAVRAVVYEAAAVEASEYLAEYSYLSDSVDKLEYSNLVVANSKIDDYLDDPELVEKYISGGSSGIKLIGTGIPDEEGYIRLTVYYKVRFSVPIIGSFEKSYTDTVRQKAYIGYKGIDEENDSAEDVYVYVAENGEVYHHSRGCTYLYHHTTLMKKNVAENRDYEPCSYCHAASAGRYVFVTEDGEKYHSSPNCSRLLRTVRRVKLSEVGGLPECHKCR